MEGCVGDEIVNYIFIGRFCDVFTVNKRAFKVCHKAKALRELTICERLSDCTENCLIRSLVSDELLRKRMRVLDVDRVILESELCDIDLGAFRSNCHIYLGCLRHIFSEIANGLHWLHKAGVVHGDLHAKNVLLNLQNPEDEHSVITSVKICDFDGSFIIGRESPSIDETIRYTDNNEIEVLYRTVLDQYCPVELLTGAFSYPSDFVFTVDTWSYGVLFFTTLSCIVPCMYELPYSKISNCSCVSDKITVCISHTQTIRSHFGNHPEKWIKRILDHCLQLEYTDRCLSGAIKRQCFG